MALTGFDIHLNREEYSRYESTRSVVRARILVTPATSLVNESAVISLEKKGVAIATHSITLNGDASKGIIVEFDLNTIVDANGTAHVNRGDYSITATQDTVVTSKSFKVVIITADEMRRSYCQGLHLVSKTKVFPKKQPSIVSGVTITNVSMGSAKGLVPLEYNSTYHTLSWGRGYPITISENSTTEILIDLKGHYCEIDVDYYALPNLDTAESILLDQEELSDAFLQGEIEKATSEIEALMKIKLEPTRAATEPFYSSPAQGEYYDFEARPLCFYEKDFNRRGLGFCIDMPYNQVGQTTDLTGFIGNTRCLQITSGALTVNRKDGQLNVLPYNSQYSMFWTFYMGINFWGVREFIADFWRYKTVLGIDGKLPAEIIKMIGYQTAISILITAEQAWKAGLTSESISKDGVARSTSYNSKGIYDAAISAYRDYIGTNLPRFRNLYRGIPMVVI